RKVIGWTMDKHLTADFAVRALEMALTDREVREGLIHHSDRGVQYASWLYTRTLKLRGIRISMSRVANPYDNARMERFIRTLKEEEVYLYEYENQLEAEQRIGIFIEDV